MRIIKSDDLSAVKLCAKYLIEGGVVCFGTDTVYGIACNAFDKKAVKKLFEIKGRDGNKPVSILVRNISQAEKFLEFNNSSHLIAKNFLPGALTLVLKIKSQTNDLSHEVRSKDNFIGFRIIDTLFIKSLFDELNNMNSNFPIALTSANPSSKKDAGCVNQVMEYFADNSNIDLIIDCGEMNSKTSTVIKITESELLLLREGEIPFSKIKQCLIL